MIEKHKKILALMIPAVIIMALTVYVRRLFSPVGVFVFEFSLALCFVLGASLFIKKEVFYIWLKFAVIFIITSIVFVTLAPTTSGDIFFPIDKKIASFLFSIVFLIASLFIIAIQSYRLRVK